MKFPVLILLLLSFSQTFAEKSSVDPLAAEISRWREFIETNPSVEEDWIATRNATIHAIAKAKQAFSAGHRHYALHLLAMVRTRLAVQKYLMEHPSELRRQSAFNAESKRILKGLERILSGKEKPFVAGLPAAVRAVAEVSLSEINRHYKSSLDSANTSSNKSLNDILSAQAQYEFTQWCALLRSDTPTKQLKFSSLNREIELFEGEILSDPKSGTSAHKDQIHSMIKQAKELAREGMEYGALYRLLAARLLYSIEEPATRSVTSEEIIARTSKITNRFQADQADHTIGRIFLEMAIYESTENMSESRGSRIAQIIFEDILPHYFDALSPASTPKS